LLTFLGDILEPQLSLWDNAAIRAHSLDRKFGMLKVDP
jgi:hypothetical protein